MLHVLLMFDNWLEISFFEFFWSGVGEIILKNFGGLGFFVFFEIEVDLAFDSVWSGP